MSVSSPGPPRRPPPAAGKAIVRGAVSAVSWLLGKATTWISPTPEPAAPAGGAPPPRRRPGLAAGEGLPGDDLEEFPPDGVAVAIVELEGPLLPRWRDELSAAGADLLEHLGQFGYSTRIEGPIERVSELPFVESVRPYRLDDTIHPDHLTGEYVAAEPEEETTWELLVHPRQKVSPAVNLLEAREQRIDLWTDRKVRFTTSAARVVRAIAGLPEVAMIYEYVPPTLANDRARLLTGIDGEGAPTPALSETGKAQLIGVADSGLDTDHPDFKGRITRVVARARPGDSSDLDGHGTHVAGSVLGSGAASGGSFRGMAPEATLFFQSIMDATGKLAGVDPTFAAVLEEAYSAGVRIHNNSWGTAAASAYLANSRELDGFVVAHPDMLVVVAAGNSATAADALYSIESPATAKNGLTVGASRSDRDPPDDARTRPATFGRWWPADFPNPPISDEALSGDAQGMAAFSGRGPCINPARLKPDLVAPGTFILSTRSSTASGSGEFWAPYTNSHYAFAGGTSMAAAIVSGCAALVRQYLIDQRNHPPSAALLKAILINGARWLDGDDAVEGNRKAPNYHQGFGCVSLADSIPNPSAPTLGLEFSDSWGDDAHAVVETTGRQRFKFEIDGTLPLRLCLAWTDPEGKDVQNELALELEHPSSGQSWYGNADRPGPVKPDASDISNNVQVIRLDDPPAGTYVVTISGYNLTFPVPPQRFALACTSSFAADGGLASLGSS